MTIYVAIVGSSFEKYINDHESSQSAVPHTEKSIGPTSSHSAPVTVPPTNVSALTLSDTKEISQVINENQQPPITNTSTTMDSVSKCSK